MVFLPQRAKGLDLNRRHCFIFDDAQGSYKDVELRNDLFKCIHDYPDCRAIAIASYGSPSSFIDIQGTRFFVASRARVNLLPTADGDNLPAAGLFFIPAEFDELVSKHSPDSEYHFHPSFLNTVFEITEGHVGAIYSFLNIILGSDVLYFLVNEKLKLISSFSYIVNSNTLENVTLGSYFRKWSVWFLQQFASAAAGVFKRGLPPDDALRVPAVASVFSSLLRIGSVQDTDFTTEDNSSALQLCFSKGWLHTDNIDNKTRYFFPSSLHRWYVEWNVWGVLGTTFRADNVLDFVIDVVSPFSPRMLSTTRRVIAAGPRLDMFNILLEFNIRLNFTVAVILIPMARLSLSLNSVQPKGGSILHSC